MIDLHEKPTRLILRKLRELIRLVVAECLALLRLVNDLLTQRMVKLLPMEEIVVRIETETVLETERGTETQAEAIGRPHFEPLWKIEGLLFCRLIQV